MKLKKALQIALRAGRQAAKIQKRNYGKNHEHKMKDGYDYATQTDLDCESVILKTLKKYFPECAYVAEESENSDRDLRAEYCWVIDPLDGTHCFANEIPFFGPMITLLHKGDPVVSVIILPMFGEEFTAIKGQGAYLNGKIIQLNKKDRVEGSQLVSSSSSSIYDMKKSSRKNFSTIFLVHSAIGMTRQILKGHSVLGLGGAGWKIWDEVGTGLLIREAGGKTTNLQGKALKCTSVNCYNEGTKIYATTPQILKKAQSYF